MAENQNHEKDNKAGKVAALSNLTSTPATRITEGQNPNPPGTPSFDSWLQGFRALAYTKIP